MNTAPNVTKAPMTKDILGDSSESTAFRIRSRQKKMRGNAHPRINNQHPSEGHPQFETQEGELVKSRGESLIADFLHREGFKYTYERPIRLGRSIVVRPDFYLKRYDVIIEFWGMLNDANYLKNSNWKIAHYKKFNLKFIELEPEDLPHLKEIFYQKLEKAIRKSEP